MYFKRPRQEILEWSLDDIIYNNIIISHQTEKMNELREQNG